MPKVLRIDKEQIELFLKDNEGISIRKAVEGLKILYNVSISTEKLRQLFPDVFKNGKNLNKDKQFKSDYDKMLEKAKTTEVRVKAVRKIEKLQKKEIERAAVKVAKKEIEKEIKTKLEPELKAVLDSILARLKIRMNVLNTIDYNLGKSVQSHEQGKIKDLTPQDRKEITSYIYALNKTSNFLFAELENFMHISDMADLKHLYKNIENNSSAELDDILMKLIDNDKLIEEKEEEDND